MHANPEAYRRLNGDDEPAFNENSVRAAHSRKTSTIEDIRLFIEEFYAGRISAKLVSKIQDWLDQGSPPEPSFPGTSEQQSRARRALRQRVISEAREVVDRWRIYEMYRNMEASPSSRLARAGHDATIDDSRIGVAF